MKKPNVQEVTCPHCHATQTEPVGVISTNCRSCGKYFKLGGKTEQRTSRAPKETREVVCVKCGAPNLVATKALSTQCSRCAHYIELGDKVVRGSQTNKLYAYDDVLFAEGCSFKGMEATGRRIEVRGKVFSRLRAAEEIIAVAGSHLSGELHAPTVRIERGATVKVQIIECERLLVSGEIGVTDKLAAAEITLNDGAHFSGRLNIPDSKLTAAAGVSVQFDAIICKELAVEGKVKLTTSLVAEKLSVLGHGSLEAPTVRAACIEVSPGGSLQARIEKYIPREVPKNTPAEPEPKAEAA